MRGAAFIRAQIYIRIYDTHTRTLVTEPKMAMACASEIERETIAGHSSPLCVYVCTRYIDVGKGDISAVGWV